MGSLTFYGVPGKMTRRLAGLVIASQGLAVFFGALVARAVAAANGSHATSPLILLGSLLAVLCILDAGLLRRPWGVTLGWVLQVATFACALVVPAMSLVGLLFGALWLTAHVQGRRMDEHTRAVDAAWHARRRGSQQQGSEAHLSEPATPQPPEPVTATPVTAAPVTAAPQTSGPEASQTTDRVAHCDDTD